MERFRTAAVIATLAICMALEGSTLPSGDESQEDARTRAIDFERDIRPILERCQPCHFEGGVKYADLPFDNPATVDKLGEKLFSRIKDEGERDMIRAFLARPRADEPGT